MKKNYSSALSVCLLFFCFASIGQNVDKPLPIKFGDLKISDFDPQIHSFDTTADAVILADIGRAYFKANNKGWFSVVFEKHQRIKVLNKNGMDAANYVIRQYRDNNMEEKVEKLKAATYNIENDKVVATQLQQSSITQDKYDKQNSLTKFGLPNVKEGSIFEVSYTITSDFIFNLRSWDFQGRYPRVWSEFTATTPEFLSYVMLSQGYLPFTSKTTSTSNQTYRVYSSANNVSKADLVELPSVESTTRWMIKNVPALKAEPFTTSIDNHICRIRFQLSQYRFRNQPPEDVMSNWPLVARKMLENEEFGAHLSKNNNWLSSEVAAITADASTPVEKAKALYNHVRDKFTLTDSDHKYLSDNPRNTWKNKKGNNADLNIMLVTLLRNIGLTADPVLISTREHGFPNEFYPIVGQYNHVICRAIIDDKQYLLDASKPTIGFGYLPLECYNGYGRVIAEEPLAITIKAADVKENKVTMINLFADEEKPWIGAITSRMGYYESESIRASVKNTGIDGIKRSIKNALPAEVEMNNLELENLNDYEKPVTVKYELDYSGLNEEDVIYLNPMIGEAFKENPFKAAERLYPVEMPCATKETILVTIKKPAGFELDEMPKGARIKLGEDEANFEYLIQDTGPTIQLRCVVDFKEAEFEPDGYNALREFYTYIVSKQSEQIVLKRKSKP